MAVSLGACNTIDFQRFHSLSRLIAMSLVSRLESKFGRFAVPNLTVILIVGQVFLYVARHFAPLGLNELTFA